LQPPPGPKSRSASAIPQRSADPYTGRLLQNRYELVGLIGQGGMGTVYMARDLRLRGRNCVVKKLRDDFYREEDRQQAKNFFEREMGVLSELHHPNIVQLFDFFAEDNDYFLVMEYVEGSNLHDMLHNERHGEPFAENAVLDWAIQVCNVLSYLHSQNPPVIYRDLKPSNIMIDVKGQVKLVDFGIARPWEEQQENSHVVSAGYSPPEQYWGAATPQSDIYSLGATMSFLLSGKDPDALKAASPKDLNPEVSDYTDNLVKKAMAQDAEQRFQTVEEMTEALLHKDYVAPPQTTRSHVVEIAAGVLLLLAAIGLFYENISLVVTPSKSDTPQVESVAGEVDESQPPRPYRPSKTTTPPTQSPASQSEMAVQVMEEKDLTDPQAPQAGQSKGLGFMKWFSQPGK
jgi:serine/threonine protein kinase